jgi:Mn-dependent DtxR family transcriptional regulator
MNIHKWEKEVISFVRKERVVTSSELALHLKISWNTAEKYLMELALQRKIERIKKKGVNLWLLK